MSDSYTPFRSSFPAFVLADAFSIVKAGKVDKAQAETLAHCAIELELWALGCYFGAGPGGGLKMFAPSDDEPLTDDEAHDLLDQLTTPESEGESPLAMVACPITPAVALKLAGWLLKAAEIIVPILL
jgi:hypothetical protein